MAPKEEANCQPPTPSETETNENVQLKASYDPRAELRSWLGKILKIVITDERIIVGCFVCTDRDGNVILENSWEYAQAIGGNEEPRILGLALIPGKHIVSVALMT